MTKTFITAFAAAVLTAGIASASLQSGIDAYGVDVNVETLTKAEQLQAANLIASGDSAGEIVRGLKSLAQ